LPSPRRLDYGAALTHFDFIAMQRIGDAMELYRNVVAALGISAALATASLATPALAADPLGTWFTADKDSQVRITNCGGALCGNLIWLKEPNDPATGQPKKDKNNADAGKQGRPLIGVPIVLGMKPSGADQWAGNVYNASDGKTYTGSFTMTGADSAELKGCVAAIFCKTQLWTRAK
jgi:uncharacterized protein (DUF2147 family)